MVIFRFIGFLLLAAALMALGADGVNSLEQGEASFRSLEDLWGLLHPGSLQAVMNSLPEAVAGPLMGAPAWAVPGVLGILVAFLFRSRE